MRAYGSARATSRDGEKPGRVFFTVASLDDKRAHPRCCGRCTACRRRYVGKRVRELLAATYAAERAVEAFRVRLLPSLRRLVEDEARAERLSSLMVGLPVE